MSANSPFDVPAYRRLFAAHTLALVGTGVSSVALALLALEIAPGRAPLVLGTALAIKMVVYICIAPFAGSLCSLLPPKVWLVVLDLIRAAVLIWMPWISAEWQIYVAIALISSAAALFTPAYQALLPGIVGDEARYLRALSWAQIAQALEQILSPLIAAALLAVLTYHGLFGLNVVTFLVSALLILCTSLPGNSGAAKTVRPWWGISAYLRTPRLRAVLASYLGVAAASAMVIVNTPEYVVGHLGHSASMLASVLFFAGLGTIAAAALVPRLNWSMRNMLCAGNLLMGLTLLLGGLGPGLIGLSCQWFCVGVGLGLIQTPVGNILRRSCHERHRAAMFAANFTLSHACWLLSYLLVGWLGTTADWRVVFLLVGSIPMAAALANWCLYPEPDTVRLTHQHDGLIHAHDYVIDEHHTSWPRG